MGPSAGVGRLRNCAGRYQRPGRDGTTDALTDRQRDADVTTQALSGHEAVFSDNSGKAPTVERSHDPCRFPLGETQVVYTASDESGNNRMCAIVIRIQEPLARLPDPRPGQLFPAAGRRLLLADVPRRLRIRQAAASQLFLRLRRPVAAGRQSAPVSRLLRHDPLGRAHPVRSPPPNRGLSSRREQNLPGSVPHESD